MEVEDLGAGAVLWRGMLDRAAQRCLAMEILVAAEWLNPVTPGGKPFSVRQANFGALGWISDRAGYRYEPRNPISGAVWPPIPHSLSALWHRVLGTAPEPECCLVNHYVGSARMGLHRDADEADMVTAIVTVSLGQPARFRLGGSIRGGATRSFVLSSGDVLVMGGESRRAYHGIDRLLSADPLFDDPLGFEGRLSLTLRRVT